MKSTPTTTQHDPAIVRTVRKFARHLNVPESDAWAFCVRLAESAHLMNDVIVPDANECKIGPRVFEVEFTVESVTRWAHAVACDVDPSQMGDGLHHEERWKKCKTRWKHKPRNGIQSFIRQGSIVPSPRRGRYLMDAGSLLDFVELGRIIKIPFFKSVRYVGRR